MNKFTAAFISGIVILSAITIMANTKLMTAHKAYKGARAITKCGDCHNNTTKLEKKKGQNYKALFKTASCAGQGCHK